MSSTTPETEEPNIWHLMFSTGHPLLKQLQDEFKEMPADPRCRLCNAPFGGEGGKIMREQGRGPSDKNPNYCALCDSFMEANPGGAEVEMTMLFVDIRGSTTLAEQVSPLEFSRLMNRFYDGAISIINRHDGFIDKLVGDEVIGLYPPGFCGPNHANHAIETARDLLAMESIEGPNGESLRVGVGVHTGVVYIGTVSGGQGSYRSVTVLGDHVNTVARLASNAGPGEALISDQTCRCAGVALDGGEQRELLMKGKTVPVNVSVIRCTESA